MSLKEIMWEKVFKLIREKIRTLKTGGDALPPNTKTIKRKQVQKMRNAKKKDPFL